MKIDPNKSVGMNQEYVLCEGGEVRIHDGRSTPQGELQSEASPFRQFCSTLDPNLCFIVALILDDGSREAYFEARRVAGDMGIHVQAPVDTPERLRDMWSSYQMLKQLPSVEEPESTEESDHVAVGES